MTKYIIISGIDGSGKTSIIKQAQIELSKRDISSKYIWMRFNHLLVKPVHAFCRLVGLSRRKTNAMEEKVWGHEFYRCRLFCHFYILLTYLDTVISKFKLGHINCGKSYDIIICDRWISDIIIDLAVDTRRPSLISNLWFDKFISLLPSNCRQYVICRDIDPILEVRPEYVDDREFIFRFKLYNKLMRNTEKLIKVDNNCNLEESVKYLVNDIVNNA